MLLPRLLSLRSWRVSFQPRSQKTEWVAAACGQTAWVAAGMGGGGMRGGIGAGVGIGIDILGGEQQSNSPPPGQPATKATRKPTPKPKPANTPTVSQTFIGKPDAIAHNPLHHGGNLGNVDNHQPVTIEMSNKFFERRYYSDQNHSWFWYDLPVDTPKSLTDVFTCPVDSDDCHRSPGGPIADGPGDGDSGGMATTPPPVDCKKTLISRHAYSVCVPGFWNVQTDNYYCCPPDKKIYITSTKQKTKQACGDNAGTGNSNANEPPAIPTAGPDCTPNEAVNPPMVVTFCNGFNWVTRTYPMLKCPGGAELPQNNFTETAGGACGSGQSEPTFTPGKCP
jgi:hypothetical protein